MSDAAPPSVLASLREFSYASDLLPWSDRQVPDLAEEFHEASKIHAPFPGQGLGPGGRRLAAFPQMAFELGRKALAYAGECIELPRAQAVGTDLRDIAVGRRSALPQRCAPITIAELATVLELCASAPETRPAYRVVPSAGAMFPIDVMVIVNCVTGLAPGAYVYDAVAHGLLPRGNTDPIGFHRAAGGDTAAPPLPSVTLALVATFARTRVKYGLRGYRFALLEAGHIAQAAISGATAMDLATLPWGGFIDNSVNQQLDLDGTDRSCVYLVALSADDEDA